MEVYPMLLFFCILQINTLHAVTFCDVDEDCSGLANANPCKVWRCTGLCTSNICILRRNALNETVVENEEGEEERRANCPCCRLDNLPTGTH